MSSSESIPPNAPAVSDATTTTPSAAAQPAPAPPHPAHVHNKRRWVLGVVGAIIAIFVIVVGGPVILNALDTVSTDDAYVNGHVTFVAPRVAGQVARVLVDDNNRVRKGDLLVQLDDEPYRVQVNIAQASVDAAEADLVAARAGVAANEGLVRSMRFSLEHAIEDVDHQVSLLRSKVATLNSEKATLAKAQNDYDRAIPLVSTGAVAREEADRRKESLEIAQAKVEEALQEVYEIRVGLGLVPKPETGEDLTQVPADLDQTFSSVRQAQYALFQAAAQIGVTDSLNKTPKEMIATFYKRDPSGDIDKIYAKLLADAPAVKQAEAKLAEAQRNLDQAQLNLRYCNVVAEIDGVVTRRDVNPGNNVIVGQSLMAVRSLTDIWIDANFKETQLAGLRIGQPVDLYLDTYGKRHVFKGRISGFTMGTGSTLALLPPENATGNFVKVVQRLPVRIDLVEYQPEQSPLFIGLSVTPYVHVYEQPTGPAAGDVLQPNLTTAAAGTQP